MLTSGTCPTDVYIHVNTVVYMLVDVRRRRQIDQCGMVSKLFVDSAWGFFLDIQKWRFNEKFTTFKFIRGARLGLFLPPNVKTPPPSPPARTESRHVSDQIFEVRPYLAGAEHGKTESRVLVQHFFYVSRRWPNC